jgi:hypothetical protein
MKSPGNNNGDHVPRRSEKKALRAKRACESKERRYAPVLFLKKNLQFSPLLEIASLILHHSFNLFYPWSRDRNKCYCRDFLEYAPYLTIRILLGLYRKGRQCWFHMPKEEEVTWCQVWATNRIHNSTETKLLETFNRFLRIVSICIVERDQNAFQGLSLAMYPNIFNTIRYNGIIKECSMSCSTFKDLEQTVDSADGPNDGH